MKIPSLSRSLSMKGRTLAFACVLLPLLVLFVFVALRSGPLAPIPVTVATVEVRMISPALSGIGIVEARSTYKIGPTSAGRVRRVDVNVGDRVLAGQVLGEMDSVDLDEKAISQEAALRRASASAASAEAQVRDALARYEYAASQARRYSDLLQKGSVSVVAAEAREQERLAAEAALGSARANAEAARQETARMSAEKEVIGKQRSNLRLVAPAGGLVVSRDAEPGTTVVAGESIIQIIDPENLWVNARFNQLGSSGLGVGLPARIVLRSDHQQEIKGRIERVEPLADAVTEETLVKVAFVARPGVFPAIGELAEVTVAFPALKAAPVVPDASLQRVDGKTGVWTIKDGGLRFVEARVEAVDLDGLAQVTGGIKAGEKVVVYSNRLLDPKSRVKVVDSLAGTAR